MQKLSTFICLIFFIGSGLNILQAQTTILDQPLLTQSSFNTFTAVSVTGSQTWNLSTIYGAVCSGFSGGQSFENEDWFISPVMDLGQAENVKLSFNHTRGSASVMNVGVADGWYKVFATADYTGNPSTTQWIEINGLNQNITTAWQYISSGELVIPDVAKSQNSRIAFRYKSSAAQSATWEIKNVKVTGTTPSSAGAFKITNWNIEWLGCTENGPVDETLQINNVASAMLSMNSDIYCLQEISNTVANPSIATLVSLMGSDQWAGTIVPGNTGECNQRQGVIYKKARVQFVSASEMNSGNASQGNSYYYNWSSGRYPALYTMNLISGSSLIPISLVNIHSKAEDGNAMSYTRRKGSSEAVKTILDGTNFSTKNIVLIGDFNDYLLGTTSQACACTDSPFKNFMDDTSHYRGITKDIIHAYSGWQSRPIIENIIISDELFGKYVLNSAVQEVSTAETINNYLNTTSNHLPVSATFQFPVLGISEYTIDSWSLYSNSVSDKIDIVISNSISDTNVSVYDLAGRKIISEKLLENTINVSMLPSGIYILKIGNKTEKFVKK